MPSLNEVLKAAGVKDEVAKGLDPTVVSALEGHLTSTEQAAATKLEEAKEAMRLAGVKEQEINQYVEQYGKGLTDAAAVRAELEAALTYMKSLKAQGFDIKFPGVDGAAPVVPGSPAVGANAKGFDPDKFQGQVGSVMAQFIDSSNEYMRLYGTPLPESSEALAAEARSAKKTIAQHIADKYKFAAKKQEIETAQRQKAIDDEVNKRVEEEKRKLAERSGSNPNLRPGVTSNNTFVKPIKSEDFHKADGNIPHRERMQRIIGNVTADRETARNSA